MKLIIENKSNADRRFLKAFSDEIDCLSEKIKYIIASCDFKIILANKLSDLQLSKKADKEISKYREDYSDDKKDKLTRGLCSDDIKGICVFYNTTTADNLGAILYHEIGHLIDYYGNDNFDEPFLSGSEKFTKAYKEDLLSHWDEIQKDKRFRLIHYVQNSTPECISEVAMRETFAHCFARSFDKIDDIDIVDLYFENSLTAAKDLITNFFDNLETN